MICTQIGNKFDWLDFAYGLVYPIFLVAGGRIGYAKQGNRWRIWWGLCWRGFQLAKEKFDSDGLGGRESLGMGNCSINIWDRSEQARN